MISLCWCLFIEDEDDKPKFTKPDINTDNIIFVVRSKVTSMTNGEERSNIEIYGRYRKFWFIGQTRVKVGDYVEVHYQLIPAKTYKQAWVTRIIKIVQKSAPGVINQ